MTSFGSAISLRAFYGMSFDGPSQTGGNDGPMYDGAVNASGSGIVSELSSYKAQGARVLIKPVGAPSAYQNPDSTFSLKMWKDRMDLAESRIGAQQMNNFFLDGTVLGNVLIDDAKAGSNVFNGVPPTPDEMDEMAQYSKSKWSMVPTVVRVENTYLVTVKSNWSYLDYAWCQWHVRFGDAQTWLTNNVNDGRSMGLGTMMAFNLLNGGSGLTAPWNIHPDRSNQWGMSPQEIDAVAEVFSQQTFAIGILGWSARPNFDSLDYYSWPSIQTALQNLANKAIDRAAGPINWREYSPSGSTDTSSSGTVSGNWNVVDNGSGSLMRAYNPDSKVMTPPVHNAGNLHCILCYSRGSEKIADTPFGWSIATRVSRSSQNGGDLALFYKVGETNETCTLTFSGSGDGAGITARWFTFSNNSLTTSGVLATVGTTASWASSSAMGPIPGIQSSISDSLVLICAARGNDFGSGSAEEDSMSATTGNETWVRLFSMGSGQGDDSGMFTDYTATSARPSIDTKAWSQVSGSNPGPGVGFMVAFAPATIQSGTPPAFLTDIEDVSLSVGSNVSFTISSSGSTPITYSKTSGPSNVTLGASTGAFQFTPLSAGTYVIELKATNSFGSDVAQFNVFASTPAGASNAAPSITHPGNKTVAAHDLLSFVIVATDADGDVLTYSLDGAPAGAFIDNRTGQFVWIPSGEQGPGNYPIIAVVTDGQAESRSTFTVTVDDTPWTRNTTAPSNSFRRI